MNGHSFTSYSCSVVPENSSSIEIPGHSQITAEALNMIMRNGYSETDIRNYFDNGAKWFGIKMGNQIQSICFIYQNYANLWEIAGVRTLEGAGNKGYAKKVVTAALKYLLDQNLCPNITLMIATNIP